MSFLFNHIDQIIAKNTIIQTLLQLLVGKASFHAFKNSPGLMLVTHETPQRQQKYIQTIQDGSQEKNKCPIISTLDLQKM